MKTLIESLVSGTEKYNIFVIVKPGFLKLTPVIINIFEEHGWTLEKIRTKTLLKSEAKRLYDIHKKEDFYDDLCNYMSSDQSTGMVFVKDKPMSKKMFDETRTREGEFLKNDMESKLDEMLEHVAFVEERAPGLIEAYRKDLQNKVTELLEASTIDESRIAQEVTIYADKVCVDEELVRLRSHIEATRQELSRGGSIGRKLDFIAQEMNRESNTILSKSDDREVSDHAIELKTSVEKIREQVQNIE